MSVAEVTIHGQSSVYDLKIKSFEQLKSDVAAIENIKDFSLKLKNELLDESLCISSIDKSHIDVAVTISGELCIM